MKNIFLRAYCNNNLGDDLFIYILCKRFSYANFCLQTDKGKDVGIKGISNLQIEYRNVVVRVVNRFLKFLGLPPKICHNIKKCDAVIVLGGSMFMEEKNWKLNYRGYQKIRRYSPKVIVTGANFGPYKSEDFRKAYFDFFSKCEDVCFRELWSKDLFGEISCVRNAADIVFNLDCKKETVHKKKIVIVPISVKKKTGLFKCEGEYLEYILELISEAVREGYMIELISFCQNEGDETAVDNIFYRVSPDIREQGGIKTYYYRGNIEDTIARISEAEAIVTSRFHGMILGWLLGLKTFPIVYDDKMIHYMQDIGFQGNYSDLRDLRSFPLKEVVSNLNFVDVCKECKRAKLQFEWIDRFINESPNSQLCWGE